MTETEERLRELDKFITLNSPLMDSDPSDPKYLADPEWCIQYANSIKSKIDLWLEERHELTHLP